MIPARDGCGRGRPIRRSARRRAPDCGEWHSSGVPPGRLTASKARTATGTSHAGAEAACGPPTADGPVDGLSDRGQARALRGGGCTGGLSSRRGSLQARSEQGLRGRESRRRPLCRRSREGSGRWGLQGPIPDGVLDARTPAPGIAGRAGGVRGQRRANTSPPDSVNSALQRAKPMATPSNRIDTVRVHEFLVRDPHVENKE
jgi:hypothetical protein